MGLKERARRKGLTEAEARAQAIDFDLACMWFAQWVEGRARETVEKPVTKSEAKKRTKQVPKYPTLQAQLGLAPTSGAQGPERPEEVPEDITRKVDELRKNPALLVDFLRTTGEG